MKIVIYLGHPAHFHLLKLPITKLIQSGNKVIILSKKKDILDLLLREGNFEYKNILPEGRKDSKFGIIVGMLKRAHRLYKVCRQTRPDLMIGTSVENSFITRLLKIPSINVNEDDASAVPMYARFSYPWASEILTPVCCDSGRWNTKATKYNSYHELAYLHPNHFKPDKKIVAKYFNPDKPYIIIRFTNMNAYHDTRNTGINQSVAEKLIDIISPYGDVRITSERFLEPELEKYRMNISIMDIHHILAYARLFIGDSQTMAAEAGVLGTPFIRFNNFVGRINYLAELEDFYKLGFGIRPNEEDRLYKKVTELLQSEDNTNIFQKRREKMLSEKIDTNKFLSWYFGNYPKSSEIIKDNPDYQLNFK